MALNELRGEAERPSVILLDLNMPVMNGWAFLEERKRVPELAAIPVILITGEHLPAAMEDAASILRKPIHLGDLLDAIERIVHHSPPGHHSSCA
jgi:CheY-like chemotaxis protein